jgi:hypothetical protein
MWSATSVIYLMCIYLTQYIQPTLLNYGFSLLGRWVIILFTSLNPALFLWGRFGSVALGGLEDVFSMTIPNFYLNNETRATCLSLLSLWLRIVKGFYVVLTYIFFKLFDDGDNSIFALWILVSTFLIPLCVIIIRRSRSL